MGERQKLFKKNFQHPISVDNQTSQDNEGSHTTLLLSDGKPTGLSLQQVACTSNEPDTTLPDLSENNVARRRWLEEEDSDEEQYVAEANKYSHFLSEQVASKFSSTKKMLPRIHDSGRVRRTLFGDTQSLCSRIKMSCNITPFNTPRRPSYSGMSGEENESVSSNKPSIQGTGLLRRGRGERAQLIDADDFLSPSKDIPIHRSIEFKKPCLTPWTKAKPFVGRPQSGQPRFSKKMTSDYGRVDMTCVGSKIKTDLNADSRTQKGTRKFRNMRAKSASLVEKTM